MPAKKKLANDITTTGRTTEKKRRETSGEGQAGREAVRRVNPDQHGVPGATQDTVASKLEQEAEKGKENRY